MCLAIPARLIEKRDHDQALVDLGGIRKPVSIALVPEVQVGDYVIVHVGHAIGILDPEEAQKTLALFAQLQAETGPASGEGESGEPHAEGRVGAETLR
jgi:hydrogenase expression/formation protein HypC